MNDTDDTAMQQTSSLLGNNKTINIPEHNPDMLNNIPDSLNKKNTHQTKTSKCVDLKAFTIYPNDSSAIVRKKQGNSFKQGH